MAENSERPYEYELVPQNNSNICESNKLVASTTELEFFDSSDSTTNPITSVSVANNNHTSGGTVQSNNISDICSRCRRRRTSNTMETGSSVKQYIAAFAGNLAAFSAGISLTWTSPSLPKLESNDTSINPLDHPVTDEQKAWISSLLTLMAAFGPLVAGFLSDKIGRKIVILGTAVPFIVGWILLGTTSTVTQILIARALWGLSVGSIFTVLPMYIGEIAQDDVRGALGSLLQLFITFGILFSNAVGPYTSWVAFSFISMLVPIAFGIIFFFMPESPYYLLAKDKQNEAIDALVFLRSKSPDGVQKELEQMKYSVNETKKQSGTIKDLIATPGKRKAMLLSLGLVAFQQFAGINAVLFFTTTIFKATGNDNLDPNICSIIISAVQVGASAITPLVVDRLGRRFLLLLSSIGMTLGLFVLGLFFNLKDKMDLSAVSFLPVLSLVVYMIVYCVGFGPLPWAVMGELFPANIKSLASTATASFCWILGFFITQYFESVSKAVGMDMSFWFFAIMCIVATVFVYILLPETKGKSLEEIQAILENESASNTNKTPETIS